MKLHTLLQACLSTIMVLFMISAGHAQDLDRELAPLRRELYASAFAHSINKLQRADLLLLYGQVLAHPSEQIYADLNYTGIVSKLAADQPHGVWLTLPKEHRLALMLPSTQQIGRSPIPISKALPTLDAISNALNMGSDAINAFGGSEYLDKIGRTNAAVSLAKASIQLLQAKSDADIHKFVDLCNDTLLPHARDVGRAIYDWRQKYAKDNPDRLGMVKTLDAFLNVESGGTIDDLVNKSNLSDVVKIILSKIEAVRKSGDSKNLAEAVASALQHDGNVKEVLMNQAASLLAEYTKDAHQAMGNTEADETETINYDTRDEIKSGVAILSFLLSDIDPKLGRKLNGIAEAGFRIADAVQAANSGQIGPLQLTNQYMVAAMILSAAFQEGDQVDVNELRHQAVMDTLNRIASSIQTVRTEMHARFDVLDKGLQRIEQSLKKISEQIRQSEAAIIDELRSLERSTKQLAEAIESELLAIKDSITALTVEGLHARGNTVASHVVTGRENLFKALSPGTATEYMSFARAFCTGALAADGTAGAYTPVVSGFGLLQNATKWKDELGRPPEKLFGALPQLARSAGISTTDRLPNPMEFHHGVELYLRLANDPGRPLQNPDRLIEYTETVLAHAKDMKRFVQEFSSAQFPTGILQSVIQPRAQRIATNAKALGEKARDEILLKYKLEVDKKELVYDWWHGSPGERLYMAIVKQAKEILLTVSDIRPLSITYAPDKSTSDLLSPNIKMNFQWSLIAKVNCGPQAGKEFCLGQFATQWCIDGFHLGSEPRWEDLKETWNLQTAGGIVELGRRIRDTPEEERLDPAQPWWKAILETGKRTKGAYDFARPGVLDWQGAVSRTYDVLRTDLEHVTLPPRAVQLELATESFALSTLNEIGTREEDLVSKSPIPIALQEMMGGVAAIDFYLRYFSRLDSGVNPQLIRAMNLYLHEIREPGDLRRVPLSETSVSNNLTPSVLSARLSACLERHLRLNVSGLDSVWRILTTASSPAVLGMESETHPSSIAGHLITGQMQLDCIQPLKSELEKMSAGLDERILEESLLALLDEIKSLLRRENEAVQVPDPQTARERLRVVYVHLFSRALRNLGFREGANLPSQSLIRNQELKARFLGEQPKPLLFLEFLRDHCWIQPRQFVSIDTPAAVQQIQKTVEHILQHNCPPGGAFDDSALMVGAASLIFGHSMSRAVEAGILTEEETQQLSGAASFLTDPSDAEISSARAVLRARENSLGLQEVRQRARMAAEITVFVSETFKAGPGNSSNFEWLEQMRAWTSVEELSLGKEAPYEQYYLWVALLFHDKELLERLNKGLQSAGKRKSERGRLGTALVLSKVLGVDVERCLSSPEISGYEVNPRFGYVFNDVEALEAFVTAKRLMKK